METKEQLQEIIGKARAKLDAIESRERKAEHAKLLGKHFKYLNSYGSTRPSWWLYAKVIGTGGYWPRVMTFQVTCEQEIIIKERDSHSGIGQSGNGWVPIPKGEWDKQWRALMKRVSAL